jgi:DNA-binding transcriptional ArsR family regulator
VVACLLPLGDRWPVSSQQAGSLDRLFGALADPTRRLILQQLVQHGPQSATRLAQGGALSRQGVVKHLQALEQAGLAVPQRVGREVQYSAAVEPLTRAVSWLLDASAGWDRRIDRLRRTTSSSLPATGTSADD